MKIIVTGGAGFIGSNLVDFLVKKKHKVIVIDNFSTGIKNNLKLSQNKVKIINKDISSNKNLDRIFKKVDYVFHLAGLLILFQVLKNQIHILNQMFSEHLIF